MLTPKVVKSVETIFTKNKISTGAVEPIVDAMEARCGGAVARPEETTPAARLRSIWREMKRKKTDLTGGKRGKQSNV
jgi:hypothetical protein